MSHTCCTREAFALAPLESRQQFVEKRTGRHQAQIKQTQESAKRAVDGTAAPRSRRALRPVACARARGSEPKKAAHGLVYDEPLEARESTEQTATRSSVAHSLRAIRRGQPQRGFDRLVEALRHKRPIHS